MKTRALHILFPYILISLFPFISLAQQNNVVIKGTVKDFETQKPIENASVYLGKLSYAANKNGVFYIKVLQGADIKLKFTCVGYYPEVKTISAQETKAKDTLEIFISLKKSLTQLKTVEVTPFVKVDTVIGSNTYFIEDFEFWNDNLVLLTYDRKYDLKKSKVILATESRMILFSLPIPGVAEGLYKDFLGNVNVICKDSVYRVTLKDNQLALAQIARDDFEYLIMPCVDTIGTKILFSDYRDDFPEFTYYTFNKTDSTAVALKNVKDVPLSQLYNFEYEYLNPKEKLYARKIEQETGIDKRQVAAYMTGFTKKYYFTPLYAPLFVVNDTVLVFDHYANQLFKYDLDSKPIDSVKINYHHPEKWKEWRRQLIKDEVTQCIYALFLKNGYYYLKEIDIKTGEISGYSKLSFPYVQKIRIRNGYAYYVYRPFDSLQSKFLYKEKIYSSKQ